MPEALARPRPDYPSRDLDDLAYQFDYFGEVECPQLDAHLYRALCQEIRADRELLSMAARAPESQPPPNLLFAAVHYLLLGGLGHPLRAWYPDLAEGEARPVETAFPVFRELCLAHRSAIEQLIATRLVQTNVLQRCSGLLPAFARAFQDGGHQPLALIEIGPSAGLNLQWDRFFYRYDHRDDPRDGSGTEWGDPTSGVRVECQARTPLPELPHEIPVASRCGVDIHPIDVRDPDQVQWLRALVWPDHAGRQARITAAISIAREAAPELVAGDASRALPGLIDRAPEDASLCIYGTHTLYQFPREDLIATFKCMQAASRRRPVHFVSVEGTGDRCSELRYTVYREGQRQTVLAARCNPHGRWLEWLPG